MIKPVTQSYPLKKQIGIFNEDCFQSNDAITESVYKRKFSQNSTHFKRLFRPFLRLYLFIR